MASSPGPVPLPPNIGTITSAQLIGTLLNFFLFGTLFIQVYVYSLCFPKDMLAVKSLVYFVFGTMAVCTCLNAADAHYWFASGFGNLAKFGQARFSPFYTPLMGSIIGLAVQLFFCYRISVFRARAMWWSGFIALISFLQAAGGIGGGVKAFITGNEEHDHVRTVLVYLWLVGAAVADILIAISIPQGTLKKASEPETRDVVHGVVRLIIETNTFSASVAIIGLALFAGMPNSDYFVCPTMILPGIYANTLLVLLNNRAAPSRTRIASDDPANLQSEQIQCNGYVFNSRGTSTINGASPFPWKNLSPPPVSPPLGMGKYDDSTYPRRNFSEDIAIGPLGGARHSSENAPRRATPTSRKPVPMSGWDDGDDGKSFDLTDVESHPYGNGGTYVSWVR
ncbi:hypothetical protein R3P38DRAFT_2545346 [Favolaschia claudopus]|uniref:DUF6534 domain-containing protein n=1 Tax=Favolaschia claudopus TaxID=2862362 RepID=A0AAW0AND7_9AGAR